MNASFEMLLSLAQQGALFLITWSWQALVLLTCVWLGLKLLHVKTPALRHQIWLLGLLAVMLAPLWPRLPVQPKQAWESRALSYAAELPRIIIAPVVEAPPQTLGMQPEQAAKPLSSRARDSRMLPALFALWLAGALFVLISQIRGYARLHQVRRKARLTSVVELGCTPSFNVTIPLALSAGIGSPILQGVMRPLILLPHDLMEWTSAAEREAMLAHEAAHLARRDHFINVFLNALSIVFYFHPLVRLACHHLHLEREIACDDYVIAGGVDATAYAESLFKAAERNLQSTAAPGLPQPAFFTSKQTLERRLEMILTQDRMRVLSQQWKYLLIPAAAIALLTWLLVPAKIAPPSLAKTTESVASNNSETSAEWLEKALKNPYENIRLQAATQLIEMDDRMSGDALVALYNRSNDPAIKKLVIHTYLKRSDIQHLEFIARFDNTPEYRALAQQAIATLKATSTSAKIRQFNISSVQEVQGPPPLPPPPPPGVMNVEAGKPLTPFPGHQDDLNAFGVLRQLAEAHIRRDTSVFERLLADDYVGYGPSGESVNKEEELAEVKKLDYTVTKFEFDDMRVSGNDGMSVASFLGTVFYQANGQDATVQYRYTATMIRQSPGGPLKLVSIHMSRKL